MNESPTPPAWALAEMDQVQKYIDDLDPDVALSAAGSLIHTMQHGLQQSILEQSTAWLHSIGGYSDMAMRLIVHAAQARDLTPQDGADAATHLANQVSAMINKALGGQS